MGLDCEIITPAYEERIWVCNRSLRSDQCIFVIFFCISCHVYVQDETVREKGNPAEVINK